MTQGKVARLRQLISEAIVAVPTSAAESTGAAAFQRYESYMDPPLVVDQSPRARAMRDVNRIARWYGWHGEITRALDAAEASSMLELSAEQLLALQARMRHLEECVQNGGYAPDAPHAD